MRLILVLISLMISFQLHSENDCERKNRSLSSEDIKRIISNHNIWLGKKERSDNDPLYANLCGYDLSKMSLAGVNLRSADLRRTILSFTNFKGSDLNNADLSGAILRNADLSYTSLIGANFEKADLGGANLEAADLR